ncbi:MAG: methyltransferase domain-containing protein [Thermoleophilia bacterium]|nr:methyltransferase domain-containing protein [Thermoleophilia bacterium]
MQIPPAPAYPIATDSVTVEIRADRDHVGGRLLLMDGVEASHVDLLDPTRITFEYLRHLVGMIDAMFPTDDALDVLQIGGGPCTLARYLTTTRRRARVRVVERDEGIVEVSRTHLMLDEVPRLDVVIGDGREIIAGLPGDALDLVVVDAFVGLLAPHRLSTAEFVIEVRRVLRPGGLYAMNLIDVAPLELASAMVAGMRVEFPEVALIADPAVLAHRTSGNLVVLASDRPLPPEAMGRALTRDPSVWESRAGKALARMVDGHVPLRDDEAPTHSLARLAPLWGRVKQPGR